MPDNLHRTGYSILRYAKNHFKSLCMYAFTGSLFTSCVKDDFDFAKIKSVEWSPELAAPLVNTSMNFNDILAKNSGTNVLVDNNKFCTFIYSDTLYNLGATEVLKIQDQTVKFDFSMDINQISLFATQGNFSFTEEQHITFKANSQAELDSILLKSGQLNLDMSSSFKQNVSVLITMPGLVKGGIPFSKLVPLDYEGTVPIKSILNLDLNGYKLDITNNGSAVNDLTVFYKIQINSTGNPILGTDMLSMDGHFAGLDFSSVYGYLGQQDFSTPSDTLSFNFFNSQPGIGSFILVDPRLKVSIINSIGVPVHASIPSFVAYNNTFGSYSLNSGIPNPLPVYSPLVSQLGQSLTGSFQLDQSNSNLVTLVSHFPDYFTYAIGMKTNPNGNEGQNFLTDKSRLTFCADIELPLYGSAKDFIVSDTADFHIDNIDQIESLELRTSLTNGFPLDVAIQVYFTDENYNVLDSLINSDTQVIKSAPVDVFSGKVSSVSEKTTDISFDLVHIQKIMNAKKVITQGRAATTNSGSTNVRIYADYAIAVRVGAKVKVKVAN